MSVIAILDPRYKMRAIDFTFSGMYSDRKTRENTIKVWEVPYEIYEEYLCECVGRNEKDSSSWSKFSSYVKSFEKASPQQFDLECLSS